MTRKQAEQALADDGLRIAGQHESGWTWKWVHDDGTEVCWWATDNTKDFTDDDSSYFAAIYTSPY